MRKSEIDFSKQVSVEELHRVMLHILQEIDAICREENIRYFLIDGTLLGAVRHGGFIPWDDDADIAMPRQDFERFYRQTKPTRATRCFISRQRCATIIRRLLNATATSIIKESMWISSQWIPCR